MTCLGCRPSHICREGSVVESHRCGAADFCADLLFLNDHNVDWGGGLPMGEQGNVGLGLISFKILTWVYNVLGRLGSISWKIINQELLFWNHNYDGWGRRNQSLHTTMLNHGLTSKHIHHGLYVLIMNQGRRGFHHHPPRGCPMIVPPDR